MIDLKRLQSADRVTDEGRIIELVLSADEQWRKANGELVARGLGGTEVRVDGDAIVMCKRSTVSTSPLELPAEKVLDLAQQRGFDEVDPDRVISYWASDDRKDRHGDRVMQNWKLDDFWANPVMLYGHQWEQPPVGGVLDAAVVDRKDAGYDGPALRLASFYASKDQYAFADTVYRLAKANIMRSGSVGFYPGAVVNVKDKKERQSLGLGDTGFLFDDNNLIEWTVCSVPANQGAGRALATAKKAGLVLPGDIVALRALARAEQPDDALFKREDSALRGMWRILFPGVQVSDDLAEPVELAEGEWSGGGNGNGGGSGTRKGFTEIIQQLLQDVTTTLNDVHQMVSDLRDNAELPDKTPSVRQPGGPQDPQGPQADGSVGDDEDETEDGNPTDGSDQDEEANETSQEENEIQGENNADNNEGVGPKNPKPKKKPVPAKALKAADDALLTLAGY